MRKLWVSLGAVALATGSSGCWLQPGFDAGRSGWNSGETTITSANVDQLVPLWDEPIAGTGGFGQIVSAGGKLFTVRGTLVSARRATTGAELWQRALPLEPPAETRTLHGPVIFQNKLLVGAEDWALSYPDGQLYDLSLADGTIVGSAGGATLDLAVAGGLVRERVTGSLGDYGVWLDWNYRPALRAGLGFGQPGGFAIVGERVAWSTGTIAVGYDTTCPPASTGSYCLPVWQTDLGATPRDIAALGTSQVAYTDASGTLSVLDAATGAVAWTAEVTANGLAVADGTILVGTTDGRLAAFPAAGCGAATCTPAWTATLAGSAGSPVAGGDVVYVPAGGDLVAFPVDGCGAATCTPLTTLAADRDLVGAIVDDGRVVATSIDGHLVAFGLPA